MKNHIRKHRLAAGLTQQHLADELGLDHTTISKWESGSSVADRFKIQLADTLDVSVFELFVYEKEKTS